MPAAAGSAEYLDKAARAAVDKGVYAAVVIIPTNYSAALTSLADKDCLSGDTITNIQGNGHTVRYKADLASNQWLGGKTWKLAEGGTLSPE